MSPNLVLLVLVIASRSCRGLHQLPRPRPVHVAEVLQGPVHRARELRRGVRRGGPAPLDLGQPGVLAAHHRRLYSLGSAGGHGPQHPLPRAGRWSARRSSSPTCCRRSSPPPYGGSSCRPDGAASTSSRSSFGIDGGSMADRRPLVLGTGHRRHLGGLAVHLHDGDGRAAEHPQRAVRRGRHRRGRLDAEDPLRRAAPDPRTSCCSACCCRPWRTSTTSPYPSCSSEPPRPDAGLTLPVNIYQTSFQIFRFGLGSAMSVISLL